jgi:hypothetical protein
LLILMWRFMVTEWKCAKTSPQSLATKKKLAVASRQCTISRFVFHKGIFFFFYQKPTWQSSPTHPTHLIWLHATFLCFPQLKIKLKSRYFDTI